MICDTENNVVAYNDNVNNVNKRDIILIAVDSLIMIAIMIMMIMNRD